MPRERGRERPSASSSARPGGTGAAGAGRASRSSGGGNAKPIAKIDGNPRDTVRSPRTRTSRGASGAAGGLASNKSSSAAPSTSCRRGSAGGVGADGHAAAGQTRYGKISNLQEEARHLSNEKRTLQRQLRERDGQMEDMAAQLRDLKAEMAKAAQQSTAAKMGKSSNKQKQQNLSDIDSLATFDSDDDYEGISGAAFAADDSSAQVEAIRRLAAAATKNQALYKSEKEKLDRLRDRLADSLDEVEDLNDELEEMEAEHTIEILKMEKEMDELENEIDDLTQQLAELEEKQAAGEAGAGGNKRRGSNQSGDGLRGPGGALAAQAMVRDRGTIDKLTKELDKTRTRLIEVEDELRKKESEVADRYEDELANKDDEINKLKRENRRLITAKGFTASAAGVEISAAAGMGDDTALIAAQNEIEDLKMKMEEMGEVHQRHCEQLEAGFEAEIRQSYEEIAQLKASDSAGGVDDRDVEMREKDEEVARIVAELKVEHVKVTQLQRELEYVKERGGGISGTVVTSPSTSSSSFSDSDVRKLQNEIRDKDAEIGRLDDSIKDKDEEIRKLEEGLKSSNDILNQSEEELEVLRVKYKNASEDLEHAKHELETLAKEKEEADRLRDAPNEAAKREVDNLKSRLETTKAQLSDKKDEISTFEAKNRAMNIQVQEARKERDQFESKNTKLMADLEKATESLLCAKNELNNKTEELDVAKDEIDSRTAEIMRLQEDAGMANDTIQRTAELQAENNYLAGEIKAKGGKLVAMQEELSSTKGEVKALKEQMKSSRDELVKKTREAERFSSVAKGADAVRDQLAQKDEEIENLERRLETSDRTLEEMQNTLKEKEQESLNADAKLESAEKEMAELKERLEALNEENMKLINDIANALNAAGNVEEATAVKQKAEAARANQQDDGGQKGGFGFLRRMTGDFGPDIDDSDEEEELEPVVVVLDDAIRQLKEKTARIKELEEAAEQHEEALLALKSDLVRLNASYKDDDYLNKKNIERLRQENTMYAMQIQRMEQELAEYREMYQ